MTGSLSDPAGKGPGNAVVLRYPATLSPSYRLLTYDHGRCEFEEESHADM